MGYNERQKLIAEIELETKSRVITFITGDRPFAATQIADDCLKPLYEQLVAMRQPKKLEKISLFLETRGGQVETPWKMVNKIRSFCHHFDVIIPFKSHSAGTMVCIGADNIWMNPMSELGPIDPWLQSQGQPAGRFLLPDLGVEDMAAYITFLRERAGITDQAALSDNVKTLAEHLTPTMLGRMERIYSHIRLVARKLLSLSQPPRTEASVNAIVEALTQKMFAHGHGIGVEEAKTIGLNAISMSEKLEDLSWQLYSDYSKDLKLDTNPDARTYFPDDTTNIIFENDANGIFMESIGHCDAFRGRIRFERMRKMPPTLNISLNFPLVFPPTINPQQMSPEIQNLLQQMIQNMIQGIGPSLQQMVQQQVANQAPVEGIQAGWFGGCWQKVNC